MPFNSGILMILGVRVTRAGSCLGNEVSVLAGSGCLGTAQILNFHEMGGGAVGKRQCLDMSVTIRLLSQDAGLPGVRARALLVLTWGPLSAGRGGRSRRGLWHRGAAAGALV